MNTAYKGKHKRLFSCVKDKRGLTYFVYLTNNTLVIKIDNDGNVEESLEPI